MRRMPSLRVHPFAYLDSQGNEANYAVYGVFPWPSCCAWMIPGTYNMENDQ